ncbi:winged helix DNA-binding domain-containing protein [Nonomuraea dietziae]|uniref:winged helix DNA-binding domain-containing protein n=1 Tax=Nonomuraea dietziae TaxID=65515 RepID=UPI0033775DDF
MHRDDLPWLLALTRNDTGTLRRLAQEGVTGDDLPHLIDRALAGQGPLTKAQLEERLAGRAKGQGVVHLVALAAFHGLAVLGPLKGGKPTYVHAADWLGAPISFEPDRDRALAELAVRYLRAHAPATPEDLSAWSGLPVGTARTAFRLAAPSAVDDASEPGGVRLAPAFDEYLMGWADRTPILDERHRREVFPGGGILRPVMLVDGVIRGTWSRKGETVTLSPFEESEAPERESLGNGESHGRERHGEIGPHGPVKRAENDLRVAEGLGKIDRRGRSEGPDDRRGKAELGGGDFRGEEDGQEERGEDVSSRRGKLGEIDPQGREQSDGGSRALGETGSRGGGSRGGGSRGGDSPGGDARGWAEEVADVRAFLSGSPRL